MRRKIKFKSKYVLAKGYPWFYGMNSKECIQIGMNKKPIGVNPIGIEIPQELLSREVPEYELILRKTTKGAGKVKAECTCTIGIHGWWGCPVHHRPNPSGYPGSWRDE